MLIPIPITQDERQMGLMFHVRAEGTPLPPPAPRCIVCKTLLDRRAYRRGHDITHCTYCGRRADHGGKGLTKRGDGGYLGLLAILLCVMITPATTRAQGNLGSNSSPVVNRQGIPLGGVSIAVCQPLATTGASVSNGLATLVMSSNPVTAGYVANMSILVAGFTGADTYLNAGTLTNGKIVGGFTILSVSSTAIVFAISHANASAGTNGTVLQEGNGITSCAGLSPIFQDPALSIPNTNPFPSDQLGNWNVFATFGFYDVQFYSPSVVPTMKVIGVPLDSLTLAGLPTLSANNVFTGTTNTFTGAVNSQGLMTTGTGVDTLSGVTGINLQNLCGSSAVPVLTIGLNYIHPCTHTAEYYGAAAIPNPSNGFSGAGHVTNMFTTPGYDNQSAVDEVHQVNCQGTNSGGFINDNATLCTALVGVALTGNNANLSTASVVGSDFVGKSFTTLPGTRLIQANQELLQTARTPGWFGDTAHDYSPMQTNTIFSGSLSISAYLGMFGNGSAGIGALTGEVVADAIQTGHAIWHGNGVVAPAIGYWCGASTFACDFIGYDSGSTTNQSNQPLATDSPTYGVVLGEKSTPLGQSNVAAFFSSGAGTTCTLLAAPNGASEVGNTATYTCNAPIASPFVAGAIAHMGGIGQNGYNTDCIILTVTTPSFTCLISNIYTAQFAISGASETAGTVTITTTLACPFTTGETVTIANIINANPTTNNGYNGPFTVLTPGCNGGSTFTYTNAITGLATCASAFACTGAGGIPAPVATGNPLPASGGGTAVASLRQAFTEYHDANSIMHWGYASPPAGNGVDQMTLTNAGQLTAAGINSTGNIFATSGVVGAAALRSATANQAGSGQLRLANTDHVCFRNAANSADDCFGEIQTQSVAGCTTTGGAAAFTGPCTVTVTWPSAFADANYRVTCIGLGPFTAIPLLQGATGVPVAASVTVQTQQATGVNAAFTTIQCTGIHQ